MPNYIYIYTMYIIRVLSAIVIFFSAHRTQHSLQQIFRKIIITR